MMTPRITMREALHDDDILGLAIAGDSWLLWRVLLIAAMGEELTDEERALFEAVTKRRREPGQRVSEFWGSVGRRGGKTRAAATLVVYIACLCDHTADLASGERGVVPVMASTEKQAARAFNQTMGILESSPTLCGLIEGQTADTIRLATGVDIEITPANFKTIRGITAVAAVADEAAFYAGEGSKNPDTEILAALRPALATTGGVLWVISSPFAQEGEFYETVTKQHAPDGNPRILVARGPTDLFNPAIDAATVANEYERDPISARTEYGGEFRAALASFVSREIVTECTSAGVLERLPRPGTVYRAFTDASGGSGQDSMTLAIAHVEGGRAVLDAVREVKPPFSPAATVDEFCHLLKAYGIREISGDEWGSQFVQERFRDLGIQYRRAEGNRSQLYMGLLPRLNSKTVDLLDIPVLREQLAGLERRVAWGGRESIDHAKGKHDDVANAVAGVVVLCATPIFETRITPMRR